MEILGKKIGEGAHRVVYEYLPDPMYVAKVLKSGDGNTREIEHFQMLEAVRLGHLAAPCMRHLKEPDIILMERAEPCGFEEGSWVAVPLFFPDFKPDNYGMLRGNLVAVDYERMEAPTGCMRKVQWHRKGNSMVRKEGENRDAATSFRI